MSPDFRGSRCTSPASLRLLVSPALLAAACALLGACGSTPAPGAAAAGTAHSHPSASHQGASHPARATSHTGAADSPGTISPGPSTPASAAGPPSCLASGLQAQLGPSDGTAGTIYQDVVLTNTSGTACTLYGYPGVSFVTGAGGRQIGAPATRNTAGAEALVTLPTGGQASLLLAVHDAGAFSNCRLTSVGWLRIYPPGDYGSVYVQYQTQACANPKLPTMSVTAVRPGAGSASS